MVIKPNGIIDSQFLEVEGNGVHANLKPSLKDIPGDYQCRAIITMKDETVIPEQIFTYTVTEDKFLAAFNQDMASSEDYSFLTDILGRLSTIETDEQQRQVNEAERILSEEARKAAENNRVEAELTREHNDADREKEEATRNTNEFNRKTFESARVEAESNRVKAENSRVEAENLRVEAEKLRSDNYDFMTSDEERRRSEENSRIEAEKLRVKAEKTRVNEESQRRTIEQVRVLKENERNSKELERKSNESERVQAETNRSDRYNNFITGAESAVNNFKAYTSTAKQNEETRKVNELSRVEAEDGRVSNEILRISNENTRKANEVNRVEAETNRQSKFDAKISEVDNKVVEVNVAKDALVVDTKEAMNTMKEDVANAIAAGTNDLEVKEARKDLNGKTHESLKLRIESDFEGLKESQDMAYGTDKGYLVCEKTKNGTVKDLKISGKSLVNICTKRDFTIEGDGVGLTHDLGGLTEPIPNGVEYTVIAKVPSDLPNKNCFFRGYDKNGSGKANIFDGGELYNNRGSVLVKKVTNAPTYDTPLVNVRLFTNTTTGTFKLNDVMVIIGDHTQSPPNAYFEGITSVGNGVDKIEVSSVKADGNLFDKSSLTEYIIGNDAEGVALDYHRMYSSGYKFYINTDDVVTFSYKCKETTGDKNPRFRFVYTDGSQSSIHPLTSQNMTEYTLTSNSQKRISHIEVVYSKALGNWIVDLDSIMINKGSQSMPYQPYKEDKKTILFKDADGNWKPVTELRGLDAICDTIELHNDGKYYYHQRTIEKTFNGDVNEDWRRLVSLDTSNTERYAIYFNDVFLNSCGMCDKIPYVRTGGSDNCTCIYVHNTDKRIDIRRLKTDNRWSDVQTFKTWLQTNNITLICQLAEEKVFEVNPLFFEAYEGETIVSVDSGLINAPMEFKLTPSLPNLVLLNQKRIKELENQMVTMFKSVLNGDMRTLAETIYPEDFIEENRPMLLI